MKDYLEFQQLIVKSPREVIKQAYQIELIDDGHIWIDALTDRNLTVHTYNEQLAKKWLKIFPLFIIHNLKNYMKNWLRSYKMYGLLERDFKFILKAISGYSEIEEVIIFGSRAMGNYKKVLTSI